MMHFQESEQTFSTKPRGNRPSSKRLVFPVYRVGEFLDPNVRHWPEGTQFRSWPGGHELTLFMGNVHGDLVDDVRRGPAEFALIVEPPVIVLAYRFGTTIPWTD